MKVTYDLNQLDASFLPSLKDTILTALSRCVGGPKIIVVQLCLSLAGLALQFPSWQPTAVAEVIEKFGRVPASVPTLLQFLTVLPEEINGNSKIPVTVCVLFYLLIGFFTIDRFARTTIIKMGQRNS